MSVVYVILKSKQSFGSSKEELSIDTIIDPP